MGLYDDGGIQFAEDTFAKSRAYKEKIAKDQDNFTKNLFGIDKVVQGASFLINQRAEEADSKMLPQKAKYQALNTSAENWRSKEQERIQSGKSVKDYLYTLYLNQMKADVAANDDYSKLNTNSYLSALREQATKMSEANVDEYEALIKAANNIPTFEDFTEYYEDQADIPRNLFSWITKGAKKVFKKETPETLKIKNAKADDALYGTKMFDKYKDLKSGLLAYEVAYGEGDTAIKILDKLKEDNLLRGDYAGAERDLDTFNVRIENGIIYKDKIRHFASTDADGKLVYRPEDKHVWATTEVEVLDDDKSGMLGANSEKVENFFGLIKEEYRHLYAFVLQEKGEDGEVTIRGKIPQPVYNKAWLMANNNPHHWIMDGANEENLMQSLDTYTNIIYNGLYMDAQNNFNRDANGFNNPNFDPNTAELVTKYDREADRYSIINKYAKFITAEGLDLAGLNEAFQNKVRLSNTKPVENKEEQEFKNATPLSSLVSNANKNSWIGYLNNSDSEFYNLFDIPKLIAEQGSDKRYILLKDINGNSDLNLSLVFTDFGFDPNLTKKIYFDIETNSIIFK